jgi:serine/threonine protein phosphatase PrpC
MQQKIKYISNSIQGHRREKNQDRELVIETDTYKMFIVFDGLSSHAYSFKFIDEYKKFLIAEHSAYLDASGNKLNNLIFDANKVVTKQNIHGLSTISGIFISDEIDAVMYFNLGDSRIYTVNKDEVIQITVDDNITMQTHLVTRCLGLASLTLDDFEVFEVEKQNDFLLCTDGFYPLMHDQMNSYIQLFQNKDLHHIKNKLYDIQKDINYDDATYILIRQNRK